MAYWSWRKYQSVKPCPYLCLLTYILEYVLTYVHSSYYWGTLMTIRINEVVQAGDFDAKSYKWNFLWAFWKCVLVEFVLVETVLVGDPLYIKFSSFFCKGFFCKNRFSTNESTQQFQEVVHQIFEYIRFWATPFFSKVVPCESP